jgi:hypothetical protein
VELLDQGRDTFLLSSAARTNLSSQSVTIHYGNVVGRGVFRIAYAGTYQGGQRNQQ